MTQNIDEKISHTNTIDDEIIDNLVKHILSLKVDLKSRRYDEEIQTDDIKEQWLKKTLKNDPALFLEKWGKHLKLSDLEYFEPLKDDYEIAYHLRTLKKNSPHTNTQILNNVQDPNVSYKIIRNRRYNYVQRHPEYFTLENLQERNPYEYEEYIGQYIPEDKRVEFQPFQNNMSLVERMYFDIDHQRMNDEIEEMEDILYQEEEKEKEEDKRDNELIKEKEKINKVNKGKTKNIENENNNNNNSGQNIHNINKNEPKNNEENSTKKNEYEKENKSLGSKKESESENIRNQENVQKVPNENETKNEMVPSKIQIQNSNNDDDVLKLSDKNKKFYQMTNFMEEEDDFVEEEDDSDEEYNEETILKEIERRRELKKQEQEEQKKKELLTTNVNNDTTKGKRTKIRIINPAYYDNINNEKTKIDTVISNNTKINTNRNTNIDTDTDTDTNSNIKTNNITPNNENIETVASTATTSTHRKNSIEEIFNVKIDDDEDTNKNNRISKEEEEYKDEEDDEISEELKQYYYNEFINIMKKEFIDGNDKNFDYSMIDNCEDYDDIQLYEQDIHERYFEDNDEIFYSNHQNLQKRYYDERSHEDMEDILAEESYFDYD